MKNETVIIGNSPAMRRLRNLVERLALRDTTVLITGEAGTGKELFARTLHQRSIRRDRSFLPVDCAALNELPGSDKRFDELYEIALGSTIFLNEVGALSPELQSKLLRLLQQRHFQGRADTTSHRTGVQFIAATVLNLAEMVTDGQFREDLYKRLNIVTVELPPLREHKEDIPLLADHFIHRLASDYGRRIAGLSPNAQELLLRYDWPSNVRELEDVLGRAIITGRGEYILPGDLPGELL